MIYEVRLAFFNTQSSFLPTTLSVLLKIVFLLKSAHPRFNYFFQSEELIFGGLYGLISLKIVVVMVFIFF